MNRYNPDTHQRRSIRLKKYDYSGDGAYFVTLCTFDRGCHFEQYEQLKTIIGKQWQDLPERFSGVILDEFVIMPNHFHGIIIFRRGIPCGCPGFETEDHHGKSQGHPQGAALLGEVIGAFKSLCVNDWLKIIKEDDLNATGKFWQKNYYEHIIRNDIEMTQIRQYIIDNPLKWESDRENPLVKKPHRTQPGQWMV